MPDALLANDLLPKSLSDTEVIGSPPKSPSMEQLAVEELSSSTAAAGDRFWLILAHVPEETVEVLLASGEEMIAAEDVVERDKLVTFVIPRLPNSTDDIQLCLRSSGSEVRIPVIYSESDRKLRRSPSQLVDCLREFSRSGEILPLLRPFVTCIRSKDADENTPLHLAAKNTQSYALKALLSAMTSDEKPDVINLKNQRGQTALHCAIRSGDPDSVHYLVNNGADVTLKDGHENTALHYLADAYNEAIFKEVLEPKDEAPLPLEELNDEGHSALHLAVRRLSALCVNGQEQLRLKLSLVEMLLDAGCQVSTLDGAGKSPLMHAVIMNDPELVQFLIQKDANCNVEDKSGATALLLARQNANYVVLGMLLDGGADPKKKNLRGECLAEWDDETAQRIIGGHRVTPPPKEQEWSSPKDLPNSAREALFGRSVRPHVETGISRVIIKRSSPSSPTRSSLSPEPLVFDDRPGPSRSSVPTRQATKAFCKDDISCLDYLTRLRLSKLLDLESKWQQLANELGCQHMIELIAICSDEDSSPSMILLDQFEQLPDAKISQVRDALERMGQSEAVDLIDQRVVF